MRILYFAGAILCAAAVLADTRPNFIVILADDLGYNDLGCFCAKQIRTPQLDRMANEGRRFTDFYVGGPTCTPWASSGGGCWLADIPSRRPTRGACS